MVRFEQVSVRPDAVMRPDREELRVSLSLLPIRLHIDQDALEFFIAFFGGMPPSVLAPLPSASSSAAQPMAAASPSSASAPPPQQSMQEEDPQLSFAVGAEYKQSQAFETASLHSAVAATFDPASRGQPSTGALDSLTYFQHFHTPTPIRLCVEYRPKRVDYKGLVSGRDYSQLAHLVGVENVQLTLKPIKTTGIAVRLTSCYLLCVYLLLT
jgi:hypothetical protein